MIEILIAHIDHLIKKQIDQIQSNPDFETLEASWHGLMLLLKQQNSQSSPPIKIKLLSITLDELQQDLTTQTQVDESILFDLIYTQEFDQPGGEPISILLGDYFVNLDHVMTLKAMGAIARTAFTPFVCSVSSEFLNLNNFEALEPHINLNRIFSQDAYKNFIELQKQEESAFLALLLPSILLTQNKDRLLWGNPIYAFGINLCEVFHNTAWFYALTQSAISLKTALPLHISEQQEMTFNGLGLISLFQDKYTQKIYLHRIPTLRAPFSKTSSQLHNILAVSRFGQTLKVLLRNKLGSMNTIIECENFLNQWLQQYCALSHETNSNVKFKYPLRKARVSIIPNPSKSSHYLANIQLEPHHHYNAIDIALKLTSEVYNPAWSNNS